MHSTLPNLTQISRRIPNTSRRARQNACYARIHARVLGMTNLEVHDNVPEATCTPFDPDQPSTLSNFFLHAVPPSPHECTYACMFQAMHAAYIFPQLSSLYGVSTAVSEYYQALPAACAIKFAEKKLSKTWSPLIRGLTFIVTK